MNKKEILEKKLSIYRKMREHPKDMLSLLKQEQIEISQNINISDVNKIIRKKEKGEEK